MFVPGIYAQQPDLPVPMAVISCGVQPAQAKPNLLHRLLLRRRKAHPIPFVFHQTDYRVLTPDTVTLWHLDEARRVGVHVPARLCAAALASSNAIPEPAAAASAAKKSGTQARR
jgi:hypothetical protein